MQYLIAVFLKPLEDFTLIPSAWKKYDFRVFFTREEWEVYEEIKGNFNFLQIWLARMSHMGPK